MTLDRATQTLIHEVEAIMRSLPTDKPHVKKRFVDDYHGLVNELETATGSDLSRYRISDDDLESDVDRFAGVLAAGDLASLPKFFRESWETPEVSVDVLRSKGSRLVAFFRTRMSPSDATSKHHITISGDGNQMVVGIAGGSLDQSVTFEVGAGDDSALLAGLEKLGIDPDRLERLTDVMESAPDEASKCDGVRAWLYDFATDTLSGTLSAAAASQLPFAIALGMGYLA